MRELIEALSGCDPELDVIVASDPELNHFRMCDGIQDNSSYKPFHGNNEIVEVGITELDDCLIRNGYGEGDVLEGGTPCIVICPGYLS